ncbi:MAG: hypothetical protein KBC11_00775 [Candidatus Pacebacteria bacterium]|nr:hypothetical protein [Candidatus Paceibacterota bacterium]
MENEKRKYWFFGSKLNTALLLVLIILMVVALKWMSQDKEKYLFQDKITQDKNEDVIRDTYTYTNHGFSIELPKGFTPKEQQSEGGPATIISLPYSDSQIVYVTNADFWEKNNLNSIEEGSICEKGEVVIGNKTFKICKDMYSSNPEFYWLRVGNIGYEIYGLKENFKTFKYVGWSQIEGNKEDLVSFSIKPGQEVSGKMKVTGSIKNVYFSEGEIPVTIADNNKKTYPNLFFLARGLAADYYTKTPAPFSVEIDFTSAPKGSAYIVITERNEADPEEIGYRPMRQVFIPVVIK